MTMVVESGQDDKVGACERCPFCGGTGHLEAVLTVKQAARAAQVEVATVYGWLRSGVLKHQRRRREYLIRAADLMGLFTRAA